MTISTKTTITIENMIVQGPGTKGFFLIRVIGGQHGSAQNTYITNKLCIPEGQTCESKGGIGLSISPALARFMGNKRINKLRLITISVSRQHSMSQLRNRSEFLTGNPFIKATYPLVKN